MKKSEASALICLCLAMALLNKNRGRGDAASKKITIGEILVQVQSYISNCFKLRIVRKDFECVNCSRQESVFLSVAVKRHNYAGPSQLNIQWSSTYIIL